MGKGTYANLAIIAHSTSEFILDFATVLPGIPKADVQARIVMTPENAKRLMFVLHDNVVKFEQMFGPIRMPELQQPEQPQQPAADGSTFVPPLSDFKGEA